MADLPELREALLDQPDDEEADGGDGLDRETAGPASAERRPQRARAHPTILDILGGHHLLARIYPRRLQAQAQMDEHEDEDEEGDDSDEDDDSISFGPLRMRTRGRGRPARSAQYPAPPSTVGQELMRSGPFGCTDQARPGPGRGHDQMAKRLMRRELGVGYNGRARLANQIMAQVGVSVWGVGGR